MWAVDYVLTLKTPATGRERYIFIYMLIGYGGSILFAAIVFYNIYGSFGLTTLSTCYIKEGPSY